LGLVNRFSDLFFSSLTVLYIKGATTEHTALNSAFLIVVSSNSCCLLYSHLDLFFSVRFS